MEANEVARAEEHLDQCEFCRELADRHRLYRDNVEAAAAEQLPDRARVLADDIFRDSLKGAIVNLRPHLANNESGNELLALRLAADGEDKTSFPTTSVHTLFSENPELVLRITHDRETRKGQLQLLAKEPELAAHVLINVPELNLDLITDEDGHAVLDGIDLESLEGLSWQVKLPAATFTLEALVYDKNKTEYAKEVVLETDRDDRVRVTFEGKTEGKQISIEILALDGSSDFGEITVALMQGETSQTSATSPQQPVTFVLDDPAAVICIRLFPSGESAC